MASIQATRSVEEEADVNDANYKQIAKDILHHLYWDCRNVTNVINIPTHVMQIVTEAIEKSFFDDYFKIKDRFCYSIFANILGIRKQLMEEDHDSMIMVVAPPGYGKSSFSCMIARVADPKFTPERVIFSIDELKKFLNIASKEHVKVTDAMVKGEKYESPLKGKAVVLDEGVYMLFSGDAMTRYGKLVQKIFSIIRALNLMIIVNSTNIARINRGVITDRLSCLLRIPNRGFIHFYNKKRIKYAVIQKGRRIQYSSPTFMEYAGYLDPSCQFWKEYLLKKAMFLKEATEEVKID